MLNPYPVGISYEQMHKRFQETGLEIIESKKAHHATHDMKTVSGLHIRMSKCPLIDKIYEKEMKVQEIK